MSDDRRGVTRVTHWPDGHAPRDPKLVWVALESFGAAMRARVEADAAKLHWRQLPQYYLLERLRQALDDLLEAAGKPATAGAAATMDECVEVAALVMMLYDNELEGVRRAIPAPKGATGP